MTERFVPEMFQTEGKPADLVVSRDCFKDVEKQLDALIGPASMWHPRRHIRHICGIQLPEKPLPIIPQERSIERIARPSRAG